MRWVRALLSVMAMAGIIYGFIVGKITATDYILIAGAAIAWWYTSRDKEKEQPK